MPASTDHWINDSSGDPLLVIAGEVDAALTKAMPRLLREVRGAVGERKVTIVFDRGGFSPKLFATMIKDGFDVLTYRKGHCRRVNERRFVRSRAVLDGCSIDYLLHDQPVRFLKSKLRLRQVTRLCDGGHQTFVITSRWDLCDVEVATAYSSAGDKRTSSSTCEKSSCSMRSSITRSSWRTQPALSQSGAPRFGQGDPCGPRRSGKARTRIGHRCRE